MRILAWTTKPKPRSSRGDPVFEANGGRKFLRDHTTPFFPERLTETLRDADTPTLIAAMQAERAPRPTPPPPPSAPPPPLTPAGRKAHDSARRERAAAAAGRPYRPGAHGPIATNFSPKMVRKRLLVAARRAGIKLPLPSRYADETPEAHQARRHVAYLRRKASDAARRNAARAATRPLPGASAPQGGSDWPRPAKRPQRAPKAILKKVSP